MAKSQDVKPFSAELEGWLKNGKDKTFPGLIRLFEETKKEYGTLDILVNNAAFHIYQPIEQVSAETFHQHFNVNVL